MCSRFRSYPFRLASFRLPLFRFWLLSLCFFLSSFFPFPPHSRSSSVLPLRLSASWLLHFRSTRFPVLPFHFFVLGSLFVSFHPSRFRSHSCFPGASLLLSLSGFSSLPLSFVRFRSASTTQPSALSFPFFPFSPDGGASGAPFLFRLACLHAFLPIPVLSFLHFLSPLAVSPHSGYLSASAFSLSVPGLFPLALALGSGYLALGFILSDTS